MSTNTSKRITREEGLRRSEEEKVDGILSDFLSPPPS